jgi:hypothetical protein
MTRAVEALYRLAGLDDVADRIRRTNRRPTTETEPDPPEPTTETPPSAPTTDA